MEFPVNNNILPNECIRSQLYVEISVAIIRDVAAEMMMATTGAT